MIKLSPSVLACDFGRLAEEIKTVDAAGAEYIHLDVMDGAFVPNISFGPPVIGAVRGATNKVFDVHLMIEEPIRYIDDYKKAGADILTVHLEACKHIHSTIQAIKAAGMKVGVSINPGTPVTALEPVLADVDMVLIMTVNPGFGGQSFIPSTLEKVAELKTMANERGLTFDIEVDGGITADNVATVIEAGANVIVAGSAVFKGDAVANVAAFKEVFAKYQ